MGMSMSKLLVANTGEDTVSIIDLEQKAVCDTIDLSASLKSFRNINVYINGAHIGPQNMIIGKEENIIYTTNSYHNSVFKININTKSIEDIVYVGSSPYHLVAEKGYIFVANNDSNSISVIEEENFKLVENIPVGAKPHDIKIDSKNGRIFVTNLDEYSISMVSLDKLYEERIRIDSYPLHLYLGSKNIYIITTHGNGISKSSICLLDLDSRSIIKKIEFKGMLIDAVIIEEENTIFAANAEDGFLYKVNIEKGEIVKSYNLDGMPNVVLWDKEDMLYISNAVKKEVTIFDIRNEKITKRINVGMEANGLLFI